MKIEGAHSQPQTPENKQVDEPTTGVTVEKRDDKVDKKNDDKVEASVEQKVIIFFFI